MIAIRKYGSLHSDWYLDVGRAFIAEESTHGPKFMRGEGGFFASAQIQRRAAINRMFWVLPFRVSPFVSCPPRAGEFRVCRFSQRDRVLVAAPPRWYHVTVEMMGAD